MADSKRRTSATRLLCSAQTVENYEAELVHQISELKRLIGKGEFTDALVRVALRHRDEIQEELNR